MGSMDAKKPYAVVVVIQLIYAGLVVISKAAFDNGLSPYVYMFYRQAAASILLLFLALVLDQRRNAAPMSFRLLFKIFLLASIGITITMSFYIVSLKYTCATVASAAISSIPVMAFFLAVLLRMEVIKLRSSSGVAKASGVVLCLAGVLVIAFYTGPSISPLNHHHAFTADANVNSTHGTKGSWIKGTFLMLLACVTWALWIVLQAPVLKEYPNKLLVTLIQCVFSTLELFLVAVVAERDFSKWKLRFDIGLLAVAYSALFVTGLGYYLQAWCIEKKGPVFLAMSNPLCLVFTIFCSSFFLGEIVHLGSILGGVLLVGGLYSVLWGKSQENKIVVVPCEGAEEEEEAHESKEQQEKSERPKANESALPVQLEQV